MSRISIFILLFTIGASYCSAQNLTVYRSKVSVQTTTDKLVEIIEKKNLIFFETVSHHAIASERGMDIDSTNVVLFEDPVLTSQLIGCSQTAALDLPMKIMVFEEHGDIYIGYVDPQLMRRRFLINGCHETLNQMTSLMVRVVNETLRSK
ncbi:MAG: DUF302 domain-containing protein [Cyclobacteriaceae bacterium]